MICWEINNFVREYKVYFNLLNVIWNIIIIIFLFDIFIVYLKNKFLSKLCKIVNII